MSGRAVLARALSWTLLSAVAAIGQDAAVLRGTVIEDHSDVPVAGAVLQLPLGAAGTAEIETDSQGRFTTPALPPGDTFEFQVMKAGYIPVSIRLAERDQSLTIRLVRKGAISGRVPWARDGTVVALEVVPQDRSPRFFRARLTDRGEFRLFDLPLGSYTIGVIGGSTPTGALKRGLVTYPPDGTPAEFRITGGDDIQDISINLPQFDSFTIAGRVIVPDSGSPWRLSLTMTAARHPSGTVFATLLGEGSTFRITGVVPGSYDLLVRASPVEAGLPPLVGRLHVDLGPQDVDRLEINLQPAVPSETTPEAPLLQPIATIHGYASASGIVGLLDMTAGREPEFRVVMSAANAAFLFDSVAPGQYDVAALSPNGIAERWVPVDAHSRIITIRPGEARGIDLR